MTEIINEKHENVKYLPGINIGDNVVAEPDLVKAVQGANALIFVLPHQVRSKDEDEKRRTGREDSVN